MNAVLDPGARGRVFDLARRLGFDGVELDVVRADLLAAGRPRPAGERKTSGLGVPGLVLGEHSDLGGIADADPAVAARAREDVARAIAWAVELRAGAPLVPCFGRAELHDSTDVERPGYAFRAICSDASDAGVVLCYEGTLPADGIRALAGAISSPAFGCYFDVANVVVRGMDSATEIRALGPLIRRVHFKDARVTAGDCPLGLGSVDFTETARALDEI